MLISWNFKSSTNSIYFRICFINNMLKNILHWKWLAMLLHDILYIFIVYLMLFTSIFTVLSKYLHIFATHRNRRKITIFSWKSERYLNRRLFIISPTIIQSSNHFRLNEIQSKTNKIFASIFWIFNHHNNQNQPQSPKTAGCKFPPKNGQPR